MSEVEIVTAWRRNDESIEKDAIAFWTRLGALPSDVTPEERAKQVLGAAYLDNEIVGICMAEIMRIQVLQRKFALIRVLVDPEYRRQNIAQQLGPVRFGIPLLEEWAANNPEEELS